MPADTAQKRFSAMNLTCPWRGVMVVPDGTLAQGDRQAAMFFYSGILWTGAVAPTLFQLALTGVGR